MQKKDKLKRKNHAIYIIVFAIIFFTICIIIIQFNNNLLNNTNNVYGESLKVDSKIKELSNKILGRWEIHENQDKNIFPNEYWGFIVKDNVKELRMYYLEKKDSNINLDSIYNWKIVKRNNDYILQRLFWKIKGDSKDIYDEYIIKNIDKGILQLQKIDNYSNEYSNSEVKLWIQIKNIEDELSTSFLLTDIENKKQCDLIFSGDITDYKIFLPIICDEKVTPKGEFLHFIIKIDGSIEIKRNQTTIFTLDNNDNNALTDILTLSSGPFLDFNVLELKDINFDGYADLAIRTGAGAYNFSFDYYLYNPITKTFDEKPILSDMINPGIDIKAKTINTYDKGRGIGDIFESKTYQYKDGKYILIKVENQDILDDQYSNRYSHIIKELKNGKWATTTDEIIKLDSDGNSSKIAQ